MEKLIRHRLPQLQACETRIARPEEMLGLLRAKLLEETEELVEALDSGKPARIIDELADLWEVVEAFRDRLGWDETREAYERKAAERGRFHQGVVLNLGEPVPCPLVCPNCGGRHIDHVGQTKRVHRTHLCEHCGHTWQPFPYPTIGVGDV